jgi:CubicO group peptidase (beta-lactamase class C family)
MNLASLSKAFTATAMGLLIDDFSYRRNVTPLPSGVTELTWRSKIKDVLPQWTVDDEWIYEELTIRDALSHVSGLPRLTLLGFLHAVD